MRNEIKNEIKVDGNFNKLDSITQTVQIFEHSIASMLDDVYTDLEVIFDEFTGNERLALRKCLAKVQVLLRDQPEYQAWLQGKIIQMNLNRTDYSMEKLTPLIYFLILLSLAEYTYELEQDKSWYKIICQKSDRLLKKFCLLDSTRTARLPLKAVSSHIVRFLIDHDYSSAPEDLAIICRAIFRCNGLCGEDSEFFSTIINNITDPKDQDYVPMLLDMDKSNRVRIRCGTCLVDILKYPTNLEILKEVLADELQS